METLPEDDLAHGRGRPRFAHLATSPAPVADARSLPCPVRPGHTAQATLHNSECYLPCVRGRRDSCFMIPLLRPPLSSYDAVGVAERYGPAVMERLPRVGCVLAAGGRWWWIVPSQSDVGVNWPSAAVYAVCAVPAGAALRPAPARARQSAQRPGVQVRGTGGDRLRTGDRGRPPLPL
ncbi:conserved hypothetical protein, partial [Streptomyces himastatinicus ATCC 53653]